MDRSVLELLDRAVPHLHPISVVVTAVVVPGLLWLAGFRFQWRRDRREQDESVVTLAMRLVDQQRAELARLIAEADGMRRQIELIGEGRYRLQDAADMLREQVVAARVMIHDYERRLGLAETAFPPLPTPIFTDRTGR